MHAGHLDSENGVMKGKHYHAKVLGVYPTYVLFEILIYADEVEGYGEPKPYKMAISNHDLKTSFKGWKENEVSR